MYLFRQNTSLRNIALAINIKPKTLHNSTEHYSFLNLSVDRFFVHVFNHVYHFEHYTEI